ncbi:uncharacterized protein LOC127136722 [Lathyrus oleraceus]|uniref:Uncharacterized protein n=1 Tax=Pisum sativum TaxID=3888 RepID=A0A9D4XFN1_PEA|nr:uncharacterized protein LOC127136722 [Pisum sativum]KAI5418380.1 hypothetical protein KIW84_042860 [Pisum sativum]
MEDGKIWYLTTVYASPLDDRNKKLWMDLTSLTASMDSGCIVGREFNDFLHLNEKRDGLPTSLRRCTLFQNCTNRCNLLDMGSFGFPLTWRGPVSYRGMRIYEKLDCVICNNRWRNMYLEAHVKVLHCLEFSDHHTVLLTLMDKDLTKVPKAFKIECAWLVEPSIEDL